MAGRIAGVMVCIPAIDSSCVLCVQILLFRRWPSGMVVHRIYKVYVILRWYLFTFMSYL